MARDATSKLAADVGQYIVNNPRQAFCMCGATVLTLPIITPVLGAVGFGSAGPIAGTCATAFQTAFGPVCGFSTLQSAAMSGYGVTIVGGVVHGLQGTLIGCAALNTLSKNLRNRTSGDREKQKEIEHSKTADKKRLCGRYQAQSALKAKL